MHFGIYTILKHCSFTR